jgi:hypothetical protein
MRDYEESPTRMMDCHTQLSRYAPHEVDTHEKKQECFLNELNDGLVYALEARDFEKFQGMVNKALVLENHRGMIEHKRKLVHQHRSINNSRRRVATSLARPVFHPAQLQFQLKPQAAGQGFLSYPVLRERERSLHT